MSNSSYDLLGTAIDTIKGSVMHPSMVVVIDNDVNLTIIERGNSHVSKELKATIESEMDAIIERYDNSNEQI